MNYVHLSGSYNFSALDLGSSSGECSFPLQLNKNFIINYFILLCNYVTKIYWDDTCEYLLLYYFLIHHCHIYMCVCVTCFISYDHLLYFTCMSTCIILCDYLIYFTSVITCIPSWNIDECSSYLVSEIT